MHTGDSLVQILPSPGFKTQLRVKTPSRYMRFALKLSLLGVNHLVRASSATISPRSSSWYIALITVFFGMRVRVKLSTVEVLYITGYWSVEVQGNVNGKFCRHLLGQYQRFGVSDTVNPGTCLSERHQQSSISAHQWKWDFFYCPHLKYGSRRATEIFSLHSF